MTASHQQTSGCLAAFGRLRDEDGQDLVEYALLVAFMSIAFITALNLLGNGTLQVFGDILAAVGSR
jgi:Flp pilus assembly pilin Flp